MGFNQLKGPVFIVLFYILTSLFIFSVTQRKNYTVNSRFWTVFAGNYGVGAEITQKVQEISFLKIFTTSRSFLQPAVATVTTNVTCDASVWTEKNGESISPEGQFKMLKMLKTLVECESNLEDLSKEERKRPPREAMLICYDALCTMYYAVHYALCS